MRKVLAWLAFITPCACGGRTLGDWSEQASSGGGSVSGVASGGSVALAGTGGVSTGSGGSTNHSGAPSSGGVAAGGLASGGSWTGGYASGGSWTGGYANGGYTSGGAASAGSGGSEPCFEATQAGNGICIHVRLCSAAQYETLCLMDTPSTAVCFCYVDGVAKSAKSILSATAGTLCGPAAAAQCP